MSDTPSAAVPASTSILTSIAAKIAAAQSATPGGSGFSPVVDQVISVFSTREIERRAKMLVSGFDKLIELTKSYDNVNKPDMKAFASVGASPSLSYSEKRTQEINAAKKKLDKLTGTLNAAVLADPDKAEAAYTALEKALSGNSKDADE